MCQNTYMRFGCGHFLLTEMTCSLAQATPLQRLLTALNPFAPKHTHVAYDDSVPWNCQVCNETLGEYVEIPTSDPVLQKRKFLEHLVQDEDGAWGKETAEQRNEREELIRLTWEENNNPGS